MPPRGWAKLTAMPHAVMGVRHGWGWNGKSNVSLRVKAVRGREGLCGGYVPGRARSGKSCSRSLDKGVLNGNEFRIQLTKHSGMAVRTHQRKPKEIVMSLINKEVSEFSVQAFQDNAFKTVTKADILGKWSVFFFYPADFTFVCPTELEDRSRASTSPSPRPSSCRKPRASGCRRACTTARATRRTSSPPASRHG